MRNLKRVLSLSLVSIMLLGMMVIGTSAASDYTDVDYDKDNVEAIEVLQAINVMSGDLDNNGNLAGTFCPGDEVKRSEMARIMAFLMDLDYDYYIGVNPFTDMVGHWVEKFAAACSANGIIYGRTTGPNATYDPNATVTALEASTMLLRALGYFQNPAVDQPNGFEIDTYMKVENIRDQYPKGVSARTLYDLLGRNSLEEYVFHYYLDGVDATDTLLNPTVIAGRTTNNLSCTGNGILTQVFVNLETETIDITSISTYLAQASADYNTTSESVVLNVFTFADDDKSEAPKVTMRTKSIPMTVGLANVPGIEDLKTDDFVLVNVTGKDGNPAKLTNSGAKNKTLNGYRVVAVGEPEVLVDSELTQFSKRSSSNDTSSDENERLFDSVVTGGNKYSSSAKAYYSDDVLEVYDDQRLTNKTYNVNLDQFGYAIGIDLYSGEDNYVFITGFDSGSSWISLGSAKAAAIFLDGTMDVINVDVRSTNKNINKVASDYFEEWNSSISTTPGAVNRWYTYTVDASGEYTLNPATRMFVSSVAATEDITNFNGNNASDSDLSADTNQVIKTNSVRIDEFHDWTASLENPNNSVTNTDGWMKHTTGRAWGNDDSIFIVVEAEENVDQITGKTVISDVAGVYTGVQNVEIEVNVNQRKTSGGAPLSNANPYLHPIFVGNNADDETVLKDQIFTLYNKNNYIIATVILGEAKGSDANYAYIASAATAEKKLDDGTYIWEFEAVVDGVYTTLQTNSKFNKVISDLEPGHIQELRFTGDYVSSVKTPTTSDPENKPMYYTGWNAFEYSGSTPGTPYSAPDAPKKITDEEIYDVGHVFAPATGPQNPGGDDGSSAAAHINDTVRRSFTLNQYVANNLRVDGNTLYLSRPVNGVPTGYYGSDYGLALTPGAPATVIQTVDGNKKHPSFSTVAEAVADLGDANPNTSELEYDGRIVAVLDGTGRAKWVVFISNTDKKSTGVSLNSNFANVKLDTTTGVYSFTGTESKLSATTTGWQSVRPNEELTLILEDGYTARRSSGTGSVALVTGTTDTYKVTAPNTKGGQLTIAVKKKATILYADASGNPTILAANDAMAAVAAAGGGTVTIQGAQWSPSDIGTRDIIIPAGVTLSVGTFDSSAAAAQKILGDGFGCGTFKASGTLEISVDNTVEVKLDVNNLWIEGKGVAATSGAGGASKYTIDIKAGSSLYVNGAKNPADTSPLVVNVNIDNNSGNTLVVYGILKNSGLKQNGTTHIAGMDGGALDLTSGTFDITGTRLTPSSITYNGTVNYTIIHAINKGIEDPNRRIGPQVGKTHIGFFWLKDWCGETSNLTIAFYDKDGNLIAACDLPKPTSDWTLGWAGQLAVSGWDWWTENNTDKGSDGTYEVLKSGKSYTYVVYQGAAALSGNVEAVNTALEKLPEMERYSFTMPGTAS